MLRKVLQQGVRRARSRVPAVRFTSTDITGQDSRVCAVLGAQWGDEGKGKLADVLAKNYDIVGRFNGGNNAGHTVVVDGKKFAFHLLPCGLVYPHTTNILGNGTVIHLPSLFDELAPLDEEGIEWRGRLLLSDRAHVLLGAHQQVDGQMESRRASSQGQSIGTTKKGIGPAYTSKMARQGLRVGHMVDKDSYDARVRQLLSDMEFQYQTTFDVEAEVDEAMAFRSKVLEHNMIVDGVHFVNSAYGEGKKIITEGANALMLDIDYGTYPYVTSSSTGAGGISTGLGLSPNKIETCIGVMKAYTTRVGGGPFPTELTDSRGGGDREDNGPETDIGLHLQNVGFEIGVTTGRKRRCGWFDGVVGRYSTMVNGYSSLNLTKLDVMDDLDEVKIGVGYSINGQRLGAGQMPSTLEGLAAVEVEYETMPGWKTSITDCTSYADLPEAAQRYIERIEEVCGCPVSWIGTGPGRDQMVLKPSA